MPTAEDVQALVDDQKKKTRDYIDRIKRGGLSWRQVQQMLEASEITSSMVRKLMTSESPAMRRAMREFLIDEAELLQALATQIS